MNNIDNPYVDRVFSLSEEQFAQLQTAVSLRKNKEKYGVTTFEQLADRYRKKPVCPRCGSYDCSFNGHTPDGKQRYICHVCGRPFTILSKTIFHSSNKDFDTWARYLVMITFNVPLEMMEETLNISHPTALLWRHKVFATVSDYQERLVLHGRVWIDETYIFDSTVLHEDGYKRKRGLSKDLICIVVAIDTEGNAYAEICGHGKPSGSRIYNALRKHIDPKATIIHDGEKAHSKLIAELGCSSEAYIADNSPKYLKQMALINNMCAWLKRYLFRFIGMDLGYLQDYLNWFVYLYRVKQAADKWPKVQRILRHLILTETTHKRGKP